MDELWPTDVTAWVVDWAVELTIVLEIAVVKLVACATPDEITLTNSGV